MSRRGNLATRIDRTTGVVRSWFVVAPAWLDWLLAFLERVDRRRRRVRMARRRGMIAIELTRHGEAPVSLADGTVVRRGDLVCLIHFWNERVRQLAGSGWQTAARRVAGDDLATIAAWWRSLDPAGRPVAFRGTTILGPLMRREGWEIRPREPSLRARVDDWFMRWLLVHWSPEGRDRLRRHPAPVSVDAWLSGPAFESLYRAAGSATTSA
jgi:hypothetical protein